MSTLPKEHPRNLIPELCRQFYNLGWVTGTGGGISIKYELGRDVYVKYDALWIEDLAKKCEPHQWPLEIDHDLEATTVGEYGAVWSNEIYIAPSGVQKERIEPDDLFVQTIDDVDLELPPPEKRLKKSQCTPLFLIAYRNRNAGAVIHTHSQHAVRCTLLWPESEFRITHQEMIKGIKDASLKRYLRYDETLVVPIIENTPFEKDLAGSMAQALEDYPGTSAVLVRRHGVYVWGDNWEQAKTMSECYDYLFEMAVEMKRLGLDPEHNPESKQIE